jgi:hypothetical protein
MGASWAVSPLSVVFADQDPLVSAQNLLSAGKIDEAVAGLSRSSPPIPAMSGPSFFSVGPMPEPNGRSRPGAFRTAWHQPE